MKSPKIDHKKIRVHKALGLADMTYKFLVLLVIRREIN